MVMKPVSFQGDELVTIPSAGLDPVVLPSTVVTTDGAHAFVAPQPGVNAAADADLATLADVKSNSGSKVWQAPVLALVSSLPGSPTTGDRYILTTTKQINQWTGSAWATYTPAAGWITWVIATAVYVRYSTSAVDWLDVSAVIDHAQVLNLQGGSSGQRYHLSSAEYGLLHSAQASRFALIAPNGGGVVAARALVMADVSSGILPSAQGGLGVDASAANGYALWTAGSVSFSTVIPYGSLSDVPTDFTPSAHAITHESGGTDQISLDGTQITTGVVATLNGGTGLDGSALASRLFLASPTSGTGAWAARAITPDDVGGATVALQVLHRKSDNSGNEWALLVPTYPTIAHDGTAVGTRSHINFTGSGIASVTDDSGTDSVVINIPGFGGMSPVVAALVLGG